MENFDFNAILDTLKEMLGDIKWEDVVNVIKDVISKIVDFVSGIASK